MKDSPKEHLEKAIKKEMEYNSGRVVLDRYYAIRLLETLMRQ